MISEKSGDFLQWLRGFYYTVKKNGIVEAAKVMGRAQSSVSHQIKCLEEELCIQLFDRSNRNLALTDEGFEIFQKSIEIFETVQSMEAIAKPMDENIAGRISIVATHAILLNYLPKFVTAFRKKHPEVHFLLDSGGLNFIMEQVVNAESSLGIACPSSVPPHLSFEPLFDTKPVLISPSLPTWNIPPETSLEKVDGLPFISFPPGTSIEKFVSTKFILAGITPNIVVQLSHFEHIKSYVEMGIGISILDEYTLTRQDYQRLNVHHLTDVDTTRTYGILRRKNGYLNPAIRAFRSSLF